METALHSISKYRKVQKLVTERGREFLVFGRQKPDEQNPSPKIVAIRVFAKNPVLAKFKFWSMARKESKLKRTKGEIIRVSEVFDRPENKGLNYGIYVRYRSKKGIHNAYKEFRAVNKKDAIDKMYNEMGGCHKCPSKDIEIIKIDLLTQEQLRVRKPRCLLWSNTAKINYPIWKRTGRKSERKFENVFNRSRPLSIISGFTVDK